jgi:hypothetical protein
LAPALRPDYQDIFIQRSFDAEIANFLFDSSKAFRFNKTVGFVVHDWQTEPRIPEKTIAR